MRFVFFGFCWSDLAARPWLELGHTAVIADIQHEPGVTRDGNLVKIGCDLGTPDYVRADLKSLGLTECVFAGFFPPCTHLAVSGARWWKLKGLRALQESISYFATSQELAEEFGCPYFIENPVSSISNYWRPPDYTCDPCDFTKLCERDNYTKKTCLWVGGGFRMPRPDPMPGLPPPDERIWRASNTKDRARVRSMTPEGLARAICLANTGRQAPDTNWHWHAEQQCLEI